jgi:hypothetical protein
MVDRPWAIPAGFGGAQLGSGLLGECNAEMRGNLANCENHCDWLLRAAPRAIER